MEHTAIIAIFEHALRISGVCCPGDRQPMKAANASNGGQVLSIFYQTTTTKKRASEDHNSKIMGGDVYCVILDAVATVGIPRSKQLGRETRRNLICTFGITFFFILRE